LDLLAGYDEEIQFFHMPGISSLFWTSTQRVGAIAVKAFANPDDYIARNLPPGNLAEALRAFQDSFEALAVFFERFLQLTLEHPLCDFEKAFRLAFDPRGHFCPTA
jgi:hypothetical protein